MVRKELLRRGVAIVGAGMCKFGIHKAKTSRDLFVEAFQDLRASVDKGFDPGDIETIYVGNYSSDLFEGQGFVAPIIADAVGLIPRPATRVEDACASGGVAIRQGVMAIASGLHDVVLVGGVERMSRLPTAAVTDALASAGDTLYETPSGLTFPGVFAAMATAYMHQYGMQPEHLMNVVLKNHSNGALNPKAQFNFTLLDWMQSRIAAAKQKNKPVPVWQNELDFLHDADANPMIAYPLRLFDCSPVTDGAACVLLVAGERAKEFTDNPIYIIGSGQASDYALAGHAGWTSFAAAGAAARAAHAMAGTTADDICLAEVHDCFTISEIIATEDLGFFPWGTAYRKAAEGVTARDGAKPINTSGGLESKGHPIGASGVAQAVEIWKQMRGEAGERQVKRDLPLGLTHNLGGTGCACVVHIYERR